MKKACGELVGPNMERWFTKDFRDRAPQAIARMTEMFVATSRSKAISRAAKRSATWTSAPATRASTAPTLVIVGKQDPGDAAGRRRSDRSADQGRQNRRRSTPRISPISSSRKLYTETVLNFLQA